MGEIIPSFIMALSNGLLSSTPMFKRVTLHAPVPPHRLERMCLGPHCQCNTLNSPSFDLPNPLQASRVFMGRRRTMPAYVANSGNMDTKEGSDGFPPLRFVYRDKHQLPPAGVNMARRFRPAKPVKPGADTSRCQLPAMLHSIFQMVDGALSSAVSLVESIIAEEEHLYGREGTNAGMQRVLTAMCRCFDWSRLATSTLSREDVGEFGVLYEHLLPYMKKTLWPSDIDTKFNGVVRGWPDTKTAQLQYAVLVKRVRNAAQARGHSGRDWWTLQGYTVEPIKSFLSVSWFVQAMCHDEAPRLRHRIASVISAFMGVGIAGWGRTHSAQHGMASPHQFCMTHRWVMKCGFVDKRRGLRMGQQIREKWSYTASPGGVAVLAFPKGNCFGKLVYVCAAKYELDPSAVSASIDSDPQFALGERSKLRLCWHAVRVHHRCRSMGASEAICERVGSLLGRAWSGQLNVNALMDNVYLDAARVLCIGGERDAMVSAEVARCLLAARRNPFVTERFKKARLSQGLSVSHSVHRVRDEMEQWLRASGRSAEGVCDVGQDDAEATGGWHRFLNFWDDVQQFRRDRQHASEHRLSNVCVDNALREKVAPTKVIAAQPWVLERGGSAASSGQAAASTVREKMKSWFDSPDGLEWMRNRAKMYASKSIDEEECDDKDEGAGPAKMGPAKTKTKKTEATTKRRK